MLDISHDAYIKACVLFWFPQQFHSKNGPAWLFQTCVNVLPGPKEERLMTTGMHIVADIACAKCLNVVGWKYVSTTISLLQNLPYGHTRCAVQLSWPGLSPAKLHG
jgi:hypothetical protein